jgi:tRNA modification GTPase
VITLDDTIAAISTPLGQGGIGIVRLSGPEAQAIAQRLFRPADPAWHDKPEPGRLTYGHIVHPESGEVVDEVLLAVMPAPHTYTRQDVVEIDGHGGLVPLREILSLCLSSGARAAGPGEFTLRALLNGRIDLAQAEAVADLVAARTQAARRLATNQLQGGLSQRVGALRQELIEVLAYLEAVVDFPDDEIPPRDVVPELARVGEALRALLRDVDRGMIYRQGLRTAIVGRPNVGKSSLPNALLHAERAIVAEIPGTTRDTLEETMDLQGIPLVVVDTAGIVASDDAVERLGVERSRRSLAAADLVLLVVDGSLPPSAADDEIAALIDSQPTVVVVNKRDLPQATDYCQLLPDVPHISVSALTGDGLDELEDTLLETVMGERIASSNEAPALTGNPRHRALLHLACGHVDDALQAARQGLPEDLLAIDVTAAVHALGEITATGLSPETATADLLETIFSRFCIGK